MVLLLVYGNVDIKRCSMLLLAFSWKRISHQSSTPLQILFRGLKWPTPTVDIIARCPSMSPFFHSLTQQMSSVSLWSSQITSPYLTFWLTSVGAEWYERLRLSPGIFFIQSCQLSSSLYNPPNRTRLRNELKICDSAENPHMVQARWTKHLSHAQYSLDNLTFDKKWGNPDIVRCTNVWCILRLDETRFYTQSGIGWLYQ